MSSLSRCYTPTMDGTVALATAQNMVFFFVALTPPHQRLDDVKRHNTYNSYNGQKGTMYLTK